MWQHRDLLAQQTAENNANMLRKDLASAAKEFESDRAKILEVLEASRVAWEKSAISKENSDKLYLYISRVSGCDCKDSKDVRELCSKLIKLDSLFFNIKGMNSSTFGTLLDHFETLAGICTLDAKELAHCEEKLQTLKETQSTSAPETKKQDGP